jgi:hypothetical protein
MTTVFGCFIMTVIVMTNIYLHETLTPDPSGAWFTKRQVRIPFFGCWGSLLSLLPRNGQKHNSEF